MPRGPKSSQNEDSVPRLLVAAVDKNSAEDVSDIVQQAKSQNQCDDKFLALGLNRACDKNLVRLAQLLISLGANPNYSSGNKLPGLLRAAENGFSEIAAILIRSGADLEHRDKLSRTALLIAAYEGHFGVVRTLIDFKVDINGQRNNRGRTALMTAAWRGHADIVQLLLAEGAHVDALDHNGRNVLHNLAADKGDPEHLKAHGQPKRRYGMDVVGHILQAGVDLEKQDNLGRTPLHWTCVTDHEELMTVLLTPRLDGHSPSAEVDALEKREKTPLHLAASHNREHLARLLLKNGANIRARSDGGWTCLHNACTQGSFKLVQMLIDAGADVNSELLNGRTPLHAAAESANIEAAKCLLQPVHRCRRAVRDRFGNTALLMAAQPSAKTDKKHFTKKAIDEILALEERKKAIVELLAPWNHLDDLSYDEVEAARRFRATIVDFGDFANNNRVSRESVYDLLYKRQEDPKKHVISTIRSQERATQFSWIHLPANNIAWCEALLTKRFIEEGAQDLEGYKALVGAWSHQHRGHLAHSRFMRPMVQVTHRDIQEKRNNQECVPTEIRDPHLLTTVPEVLQESLRPQQNIAHPKTQLQPPISPSAIAGAESAESAKAGDEIVPKAIARQETMTSESSSSAGRPRRRGAKPQIQRTGTSSTLAASDTSVTPKQSSKQKSRRKQEEPKANGEGPESKPLQGGAASHKSCNIFMFMPYLHFEDDQRRKEMQSALEAPDILHRLGVSARADEILIRAHHDKSGSFLHVRRTLDQFFYHNIDTRVRDTDQVVYRFQKLQREESNPKVFMVDQLWMFVLGEDLVVTSFWQRWNQPRNDPLNVLDGIIEDINSKTREPVQNVYELAMTIAGRCYGPFDRHRKGDDDFQFLDMFEASIGSAMDQEATLFQDFSQASSQASDWLRNVQQRKEPEFVDNLLDVGAETSLLAEIKDIRDELDILAMVFNQQKYVLPDLKKAIKSLYIDNRTLGPLRKVDIVFEEQEKTIGNPLKDIYRMDKQADRIYESIRDLLDLKQKHANAFEARFARDQAVGTRRQGQTIMVFTIVTVIFLPLSFIAAFFAINVSSFPHNEQGNPSMSLGYVSQYIFGIGLAISIPCIALALSVGELGDAVGKAKTRRWWPWTHRSEEEKIEHEQTVKMQKAISVARSMRQSMEITWNDKPRSLARRSGESPYDGLYGRRRPKAWDEEVGRSNGHRT